MGRKNSTDGGITLSPKQTHWSAASKPPPHGQHSSGGEAGGQSSAGGRGRRRTSHHPPGWRRSGGGSAAALRHSQGRGEKKHCTDKTAKNAKGSNSGKLEKECKNCRGRKLKMSTRRSHTNTCSVAVSQNGNQSYCDTQLIGGCCDASTLIVCAQMPFGLLSGFES